MIPAIFGEMKQRRAEGFNRAWLAHWKETK